jgi:hypothetical protein
MDATNKKSITITLDLNALVARANEFAVANDGLLETSNGETPDDLQRVWCSMSYLFQGVNREFYEGVKDAIAVLVEIHCPDDDG